MTSTQENTRSLPLIGQAVGQAQASLTKILLGILAQSGTSYQTYLALQRLDALGGEATREAYERDLSNWLELDRTAAARLAGDLVAAGLAENSPAENSPAENSPAENSPAENSPAETRLAETRLAET